MKSPISRHSTTSRYDKLLAGLVIYAGLKRKNQRESESGHNAQDDTLISRYVEIHQKNQFDVRIQELVSKVIFPGGFFGKNFFSHLKNPEMCLLVVLLT